MALRISSITSSMGLLRRSFAYRFREGRWINSERLVRLWTSCCMAVNRWANWVLMLLGTRLCGTCCGLMRITAVETKVSGHMKATTTAITSPAKVGPIIQER